jgi:hypothetical protein
MRVVGLLCCACCSVHVGGVNGVETRLLEYIVIAVVLLPAVVRRVCPAFPIPP